MTLSLRRSLILVLIGIAIAFLLTRLLLMRWARAHAPVSDLAFLEQYWLISSTLSATLILLTVLASLWLLRKIRVSERSQARIERLAEIGLLAGGLAHEIRNPLNAMQTHLSLLRRKVNAKDEDATHKKINQLERATQILSELVTDFLSYARPNPGNLQEICPAQLLREVVSFVELDLEQSQVEICLEIQDNLPKINVDRDQFKRALLNLIINARQAMPEGGKLTLRCHSVGSQQVRIEVSDTGIGIPPEEQTHIFETFFSTKKEGTGLGLAIVKRTIEDVNGHIDFESKPGQGTTFRILLPGKRTRDATWAQNKNGKSFSLKTTI